MLKEEEQKKGLKRKTSDYEKETEKLGEDLQRISTKLKEVDPLETPSPMASE